MINDLTKRCIAFFALTLCYGLLHAQSGRPRVNERGVMFIKLGNDTTAVQQFEMKGDSIRTVIIRRPGGIIVYRGEGTLYPDGNIRSMQSNVYRLDSNGQLQKTSENKLYSSPDSTFVVNGNNRPRAYQGRSFISNDMDYTSFMMFPYLAHFAPAKINDSITGKQFVGGGFRVFTLKRTGQNSIRVGSNIMGNLNLFLNSDGSLRSIDGIGSSLNFTSTIVPNLNMDSLIHAMIAYQKQVGAMGAQTIRDTATANIGSSKVEVDYWRPSMRGRKVFGGIVPYNRFWRTGANNATQLRISEPIYFNNQKLDSGRYAIFTWPTETGWTFLINKQATIWGTDYNPEYDLLRLPMKVEHIPRPVEQLTIQVVPSDRKGTIIIEWENTRASIDFETRKS